MRTLTLFAALLILMGCTGCFWRHHKKQPAPAITGVSQPTANAPATTNTFVITPEEGPHGRVSSVNAGLRFAVLTFPLGQVPPVGTQLNIYRNGIKVADVKITGPQRDDNTVADIVSGDTLVGDDVREK